MIQFTLMNGPTLCWLIVPRVFPVLPSHLHGKSPGDEVAMEPRLTVTLLILGIVTTTAAPVVNHLF